MTQKEFENSRREIREKISILQEEKKRIEQAYCMDALEKAGYHIGDTVSNNEGEKGIIIGVEYFAGLYPRVIVAKMKKDGTALHRQSYHLGFKIPNIKE